jgi:hypothetical protein
MFEFATKGLENVLQPGSRLFFFSNFQVPESLNRIILMGI